jgi:acetylornithine deacetylase/succinyl-diaminopimelate desuccinylase-like protein
LSFVEKCRRLISLETTPSHGNKEAVEYLGELCKDSGFHVEYQREFLDGLEQCNLIARPEAQLPEKELLLQTHIDTTEPGHFSLWTRTQSNPFNASIYNDLMVGLGVAESKLDFLCKLEAAKRFVGKPLKRPFVLVATYGAQRGMAGAIKLVRKKKINAKWALIGSPTNLQMTVAGQGLAVIEVFVPFSEEEKEYRHRHDVQESSSSQSRMFTGKAAHSSKPAPGSNAIMKMLGYLAQLPNEIAVMDLDGGISYNTVPSNAVLEIDAMAGFKDPIAPKLSSLFTALQTVENKLLDFKDARFDPPHPTMNLGTIRTTEDGVVLSGSCRLPPTVTDQVYESWMTILKTTCDSMGATFRVRDYRKGFETNPESELVKAASVTLQTLQLSASPQFFSDATEASVFSRWGTECIVWGPGQSVGNSHAPNESIKLQDLDVAVDFYRRFLERFCT